MKTNIMVDGLWVEGTPTEDKQLIQLVLESGTTVTSYFSIPDLSIKISSKIKDIKIEAGLRILSLNWMLERATRHEQLNISGKTTTAEVLQMQQDIESASDAAEVAVSLLTTIEEVESFTW